MESFIKLMPYIPHLHSVDRFIFLNKFFHNLNVLKFYTLNSSSSSPEYCFHSVHCITCVSIWQEAGKLQKKND